MKAGDIVGLAGNTGSTIGDHDHGGAHLHVSAGQSGRPAAVVLSSQHRLPGDCWVSTQASSATGIAAPLDWVGFLSDTGVAYAKARDLDAPWAKLTDAGVEQMIFEGDRIMIRWPDGTVHAKEGRLDAPWVKLASTAVTMDADGERIAIVSSNGSTYVKEGDLDEPWVRVTSSRSAQVHLEGDRVAVLHTNGVVHVKEGPLNARWTKMTDFAAHIELTPVG